MFGSVNSVVEPFAQEIEGVDDIKLIQEENDYMDAELVSYYHRCILRDHALPISTRQNKTVAHSYAMHVYLE